MTLGEIKNEIFNLGFENKQKYKDDINIIPQAINRAMGIITAEVRPILSELVLPEKGTGSFDLKALCVAAGLSEPLGIDTIEDASGNNVTSFKFKRRQILSIEGGIYPLHVFYKAAFTPIKANTQDDFIIQLDSDVCVLLPLLAAYYVWLDDDNGRKATIYANEYETRRNAIQNNIGGIANVVGGVDI